MNDISCDICMDLMPLVQDGVASADSAEAVERHIETCPECRAMFENKLPEMPSGDQLIRQIRRKARIFVGMLLMFGVFFGISLTVSNKMFLNTLIMPAIGIIGYYLFRWKAAVITPALIITTHLITNAFAMIPGAEHLDFGEVLTWSGIYSLFAVAGIVIAGLIHFAFRKEDKQ